MQSPSQHIAANGFTFMLLLIVVKGVQAGRLSLEVEDVESVLAG
jgi:hypothetical protein